MTRHPLPLAFLAAALLLVGCPGSEPAPEPTPAPAATPEPTPEPVVEATPAPTPEAAPTAEASQQLTDFLATLSEADRARKNPKSGNAEAIKKGGEEFQSVCIACHGATGKGDGPAAKALPAPVGDLTNAELMGKLSQGDLMAIMKNGVPGTPMQAFGAALSDDQIWTLLAYVETLSQPAEGDQAETKASGE